ncbi:MAG: M23 family metallopeptidase [Thermoanaerobaculia bacterium]
MNSARALLPCLLLAATAFGAAKAPVAPPSTKPVASRSVTVRPGSIARWPGAELTDCTQAGEHFLPVAGACLYPVDLLASGTIEVERRTAAGAEHRTLVVGDYPYPTESLTGVEEKYVSPAAKDLARIESEQKETGALFVSRSARQFTLPFGAPLAELPEGGRFGSRRIFNGEARSPHGGTDFRAATGTTVFAADDGVVVLAKNQYFAGNAVYIDHGDGLVTMNFHLSEILVEKGAHVRRGQPIGKVGATGRVTGPHLHFGARWRGARVDPQLLLADPATWPAITP